MPPLGTVPVLDPIPRNLTLRADTLRAKLNPAVRSWVAQQARSEARAPALDPARVLRTVEQRFKGQLPPRPGGAPQGDIEALAFLVMMEAAKSMEEDLRGTMAAMKAANDRKQSLRAAGQAMRQGAAGASLARSPLAATRAQIGDARDSLSEMGETDSLRMQMAMDRLSKLMSTLSNMLKKMSETQQTVIQNLK